MGPPPTPGVYLLPALLRKLVEENPLLDIDFAIGNRSEVIARLLDYEHDVALVAGAMPDHPVKVVHLDDEELIPFGSPDSGTRPQEDGNRRGVRRPAVVRAGTRSGHGDGGQPVRTPESPCHGSGSSCQQ